MSLKDGLRVRGDEKVSACAKPAPVASVIWPCHDIRLAKGYEGSFRSTALNVAYDAGLCALQI